MKNIEAFKSESSWVKTNSSYFVCHDIFINQKETIILTSKFEHSKCRKRGRSGHMSEAKA